MRGFPWRGVLALSILAGLLVFTGCGKKAPPRLPEPPVQKQTSHMIERDGLSSPAESGIVMVSEGSMA